MNKKDLKLISNIYNFFLGLSPDMSYEKEISACIAASVIQNKPINLIMFTCSTINSEFMFSNTGPERYVSLNPQGNNLRPDLPILNQLIKRINKIYPAKITIIIGNTDPYYIYTAQWKLLKVNNKNILWEKYSRRWNSYRINLVKWLKVTYPEININVVSWYELEKYWEVKTKSSFEDLYISLYKNICDYFPIKFLSWEYKNLKNQFGKGKYFADLQKPDSKIIKDWIPRKFAEYAVQGFWIKQIFPNSILLQNEKPSLLRTEMYQPLNRKLLNTNLPVLYPFGIDNKGFQ